MREVRLGTGEWGMGNDELTPVSASAHSPLPIPHSTFVNQQILHHFLPQHEIRLLLDDPLDLLLIRLLIGLGPRAVHRRAFAAIEHAELNAGGVDRLPIAPPRASISRTICPLATPPIAGLQLICATVSQLVVSSAVRAPIRAAASAASQPAWPAPMTRTSKS